MGHCRSKCGEKNVILKLRLKAHLQYPKYCSWLRDYCVIILWDMGKVSKNGTQYLTLSRRTSQPYRNQGPPSQKSSTFESEVAWFVLFFERLSYTNFTRSTLKYFASCFSHSLYLSYSLFLLFTTFPSVLIHGLLINKIKSYRSWPCEWNFEVMQRHASLHTLIAQYEGKSLRHWKSKKSLPIMIKKN